MTRGSIAKNAMNRNARKEYKNSCVPCEHLANLAILVLLYRKERHEPQRTQ
jgi:hypothetical protein